MGFYEVKSKKICCSKVQKTLILLRFLIKFCIATRTIKMRMFFSIRIFYFCENVR